MKAIPVPLEEIIKALPKKDRKEIYLSAVHQSIPDSPLIKEVLGPVPKNFEEVLREKGIDIIK